MRSSLKLLSHLEADGLRDTDDPKVTGKSSDGGQRKAQRAVMTYARYDPSTETPNEGGLTNAS